MKLQILTISAFLALAACGGTGTGNLGGGDGGGDEGDGDAPPVAGDTCANAFVCSGEVVVVSIDDMGDADRTNLPDDLFADIEA